MTMRNETIVKRINKMFGAENEKYPVAFQRTGEKDVIVTSESPAADGMQVVDYYGEYRGNYPWIDPRLEKWLDENNLYAEWENAACVVIYEQ